MTTTKFGVADLEEFAARMTELRLELQPPAGPGTYVAYTDGACFGNPAGPGGWAAVFGTQHLWGHLSSTTNNRAEALGVLAALEWAPAGSAVQIFSDSELTVKVLLKQYKAKANPEIWALINGTIADKKLKVEPNWVRGHAGDPRNELADQLSKLGARNGVYVDELEAPPPVPAELRGLEPHGDWEREFLNSVAAQLRRKRPLSDKQAAIVARIRGRGSKT